MVFFQDTIIIFGLFVSKKKRIEQGPDTEGKKKLFQRKVQNFFFFQRGLCYISKKGAEEKIQKKQILIVLKEILNKKIN